MSASLNIILFGETGVGKSSVVNLIAGRQVAKVSPDTQCCTMSSQSYDFTVGGRTLHIWDTLGLGEPVLGAKNYLPAIEQACNLIHQLTSQGGVDLLLFCIRGNRVTATTQSNYRLFYEVLCKSQVPIAVVITWLEHENIMEDWWRRNQESLERYGIKVAGHACVTGLLGHSKYQESQSNITRLLEGNGKGRFNMPPDRWITEFKRRLFQLFPLSKRGERRMNITKILTKRCGLDPTIAEALVAKLFRDRA